MRCEGVLGGHTIDVRVGPLVKTDESSSILCIHVDRPVHDPSTEPLHPAKDWFGSTTDDAYKSRPLRMTDPDTGRVWVSTQTVDVYHRAIDPGGSDDFYLPFGPVEESVASVTVILARTDFFTAPVVGPDAVLGLDPGSVLQKSEPDPDRVQPLTLERYTEAFDKSTSRLTTGSAVTVAVSSDVSFATDSAELSADADQVLKGVVDTIVSYPDGGTLMVVGHTDDVADDTYNQALSQRRAQAVSDRLGQLTSLAHWTVSVIGKGESEPRAAGTDDAARAANRRVEIVLTPNGGTRGTASAPSVASRPPAPSGPSAKGPTACPCPTPKTVGRP